MGGSGIEHVELIRRMCDAVDAGDEATLRELYAEDIEYVFVSQGTISGRDECVATTLAEGQRSRMTRDLFTADGSGRVWWRYEARWHDAETGRPRRTTGASVAHVDHGKVKSILSWVDVIAAGIDDGTDT